MRKEERKEGNVCLFFFFYHVTVVASQNKITLSSISRPGCPTGGFSGLTGTFLPYAVVAQNPLSLLPS